MLPLDHHPQHRMSEPGKAIIVRGHGFDEEVTRFGNQKFDAAHTSCVDSSNARRRPPGTARPLTVGGLRPAAAPQIQFAPAVLADINEREFQLLSTNSLHAKQHGDKSWKHLSANVRTPRKQTTENFGDHAWAR